MNQHATKTKPRRGADSPGVFGTMGESDMAAIGRKLHALLIAEGYTATKREILTGMKLNNFTDIHRLEFRRDGYGVFITIQHPQAKER